MEDSFCAVHHDRPAVETCPQCGRYFCEECMTYVGTTSACTACAATLRQRRSGRTLLLGLVGVGGLVVVLGLGGLAFLYLTVRGSAPGAMSRVIEKTPDPPAVVALRTRLKSAPCDQDLIAKLADKLNELDRFDETLATGKAWHARCGADSYLDWKLFYAAKELGRWKKALKLGDGLVEGDPGDSDFWWWRGEVRARIGHAGAALADYRQSIANSDGAQAAGFAVGRIVAPARAGHEPCEAADAIRYFVDALGGKIAVDLRDDMVAFMRQGHCLAKARGASRFAVGDALHPAVVHAVVGGTPGRFYVDATTGTTVLSTSFAKRAGITAGKDSADAFADGEPRKGKLGATSVAIGKAQADGVDVLVVDGLTDHVDGVIGLDFLWRFEQTQDHGRMAITARK